MTRIIARNWNPSGRSPWTRRSNTLRPSGTREAKWHMSKRRVCEVDEGVIVVVKEAPNDRGKEVARQGRGKMRDGGGLVQSSQPGGTVQSREPKIGRWSGSGI